MQIGETCAKFVRILLETRYLVGEGSPTHSPLYEPYREWINPCREDRGPGGEKRDLSKSRCNTTHCHGPNGSQHSGLSNIHHVNITIRDVLARPDYRELLNARIKCRARSLNWHKLHLHSSGRRWNIKPEFYNDEYISRATLLYP